MFPFILPGISGFVMSRICSFSDKNDESKIAPPGLVFMVVWPILYALIGYTWHVERKNSPYIDLLFTINTFVSISWIYFFNCKNDKKNALFLLLVVLATSFMMIHACKNVLNQLFLCLYTTWLVFAVIMNSFVLHNNLLHVS